MRTFLSLLLAILMLGSGFTSVAAQERDGVSTLTGGITITNPNILSDVSEPYMLLTEAGQSATVLVALATIGEIPSPTRAGNVNSVPPPATEFMTPLIVATITTRSSCRLALRCT